jgi:AraC-like DNA-binding protein
MTRRPYFRFTDEQARFLADWFRGRPEGAKWSSVRLARLFNERFGTGATPLQIWSKCFKLGLYKAARQFSPTPEQAGFLARHAGSCTVAELARLFNREFGCSLNFQQIRHYVRRHRLQPPRPMRRWTEEEEAFVRENYVRGRRRELLERFNLRFGTQLREQGLSGKLSSLGVYRRREYTSGLRRASLSPRPDADGWGPGHRNAWEALHGPIPKGGCVVHLDNNPRNNDPDNLLLTDRSTRMAALRIGLVDGEPELNRSVHLLAELDGRARKASPAYKSLKKKESNRKWAEKEKSRRNGPA